MGRRQTHLIGVIGKVKVATTIGKRGFKTKREKTCLLQPSSDPWPLPYLNGLEL